MPVWFMKKSLYTAADAFAALHRGEERGLDFFFHMYYAPLVSFAAAIIQDEEVAREIVSEAFVKFWNNRQHLQAAGAVKSLLYRMVRNASIDYLRQQQRVKKMHQDVIQLQPLSDSAVLEKLVQAETYHYLYILVNSLPLRCRQVFQMFYLQDKALKEIAEELGISINTVKSQKQRAVQLLKENRSLLPTFLLFASSFLLY